MNDNPGQTESTRTARIVKILLPVAIFVASVAYFASGISRIEASLLESQDFEIAVDLFRFFHITPDHSPLHFVFVNLWARLNDGSFLFVRLPSAAFAGLAAVIVYHLARMLTDVRAGLIAALLFATNPLVVADARSTRMYALVLLCSAACLLFAYLYLAGTRRTAWLVGFAASAIAGVYTHLFMWLPVGSLFLLFVVDSYRNRADRAQVKRIVRTAVVSSIVLAPQIVHIFVAIGYTKDRHALYEGMSNDAAAFLLQTGRILFLGEGAHRPLFLLAALPICLILTGLGMYATRRRGVVAGLAILAPSLGVSWLLSRAAPVEARYLCYLLPAFAIFMA
jgi:4-amino-4-deoxy-L-arabinose transferase-like glycosyltransferase